MLKDLWSYLKWRMTIKKVRLEQLRAIEELRRDLYEP